MEPTTYDFIIIRTFILAILHLLLMMGRFPRKLNAVFLLGMTCEKLKLPDDFISKLKSPIPKNGGFNQFLDYCKNYPSKI